MSYWRPVDARGGAQARARSSGMIDRPDDLRRQRAGIALRHDHRVVSVGEDVEQAVRVGGDNRLPHRQRFESGDRRPFPQGRKHAQVERRERRARRRAGSRRTRTDRRGRGAPPAPEIGQQRSFADQKEPRRRPFADDARAPRRSGRSCPFDSCSRVTVPIAKSSGSMPSSRRAAAISAALRARLNSSSGTPR